MLKMPLKSIKLAQLLIERYHPILYLHKEEKYVPVKPDIYIQNAALWNSQPASNDKRDWGIKPSTGNWPHKPIIPKKGISVNKADDKEGTIDTDGDGVKEWYIGHEKIDGDLPYLISDKERELFLDFVGWEDGKEVNEKSKNIRPNKILAISKYENDNILKDSRFYCYADVEELDTMTNLFSLIDEWEGFEPGVLLKQFLGKAWFIWYYIFYPIHEETSRHCYEKAGDGDFEGDWTAIGLIVRQSDNPLQNLTDEQKVENSEPKYVGFSRRSRGLMEIPLIHFRQDMEIKNWNSISRLKRHPKVFVARGSHNYYRLPGTKEPPEFFNKDPCENFNELEKKINDAIEKVQEKIDNVKTAVVTVSKIAAGCGIGGIFGWVGAAIGCGVGAIAAAIEAAVDDSGDGSETVDERARQEAERDYAPEQDNYGMIIAPTDLKGELIDAKYADKIEYWKGSSKDILIDRAYQIWWRNGQGLDGKNYLGYQGRWGVKAQEDPYDRRSGIVFPEFKRAFIISFIKYLSEAE